MGKMQVLVVEDEAIVSMDLRYTLESLGYQVLAEIRSGKEAVVAAAQLHPDVVLMDIKLSGEMDGIDAAAQIWEMSGVPVVYLTAHSDEATLQRAKSSEPFGYLSKPVDSRALQSVVEVAIYRHQIEMWLIEDDQWLSPVLQSANNAIVTTDGDGGVHLKPAAELLLGITKSQAINKNLAGLFAIIVQRAA